MRRVSLAWVLGILVAAAGVAGLAGGAVPQAPATGGATNNSPPIVVTGAYIRQPASPDLVAVYFTVFNTTAKPDTLLSAVSGAGAVAVLHADPAMHTQNGGVVVPAHSSVSFTPAGGHVMIQQLYAPLQVGQTVNIELDFADAGAVVFVAPVIGIYAPAPTGSAASTAPSASPSAPSTGGTS
ncbi:MAG: copper chaperone PCu(A)C [Actinobacteria bacterium]|nr:copper chaperone PCu(A)C [Actinomycetota bacterium]